MFFFQSEACEDANLKVMTYESWESDCSRGKGMRHGDEWPSFQYLSILSTFQNQENPGE